MEPQMSQTGTRGDGLKTLEETHTPRRTHTEPQGEMLGRTVIPLKDPEDVQTDSAPAPNPQMADSKTSSPSSCTRHPSQDMVYWRGVGWEVEGEG